MRAIVCAVVWALAATACTATASQTAGTIPSSTAPGPTATSPPLTTTTLPGATQASIGDPYYFDLGNSFYDVEHYDLDVVWDPATTSLTGRATLEFTATRDLAAFNLDLVAMVVDAVAVDGTPAAFEHLDPELVVTPQTMLVAGSRHTVAIDYRGAPQPMRSAAIPFGIGWVNGPDGEAYVVAEPDGARTWFPANDHPLDKATYRIAITAPAGYVAASNGHIVEETVDRTVWEMDRPMASYLATVVIAADWQLVDAADYEGIDVRHVLPDDLAADPPPALARTGDMIAALQDRFGPYPFEQYGIAVVSGFGAALENQTLSLFDRVVVDAPEFEDVYVHELAHQWFGNSVSLRTWQDVWLNEGFATFAEWLWIEHDRGRAAYEETVRLRRSLAESRMFPPPGIPPPNDLFNGGVYITGGLTLAALRDRVGDDTFFSILGTYTERFRLGTAGTDDFIALAEEQSGEDLGAFFNAWLYAPDVPEPGTG